MAKTRAVQGATYNGNAKKAEAAAQHGMLTKKPKTVANVAGLWAKRGTKTEDGTNTSSTALSRYPGVSKAKHASSSAMARQHPMYLDFSRAAATYRQGATGSAAEQLDAVHEELLARLKGLEISGKALQTAPTLPVLEALDKEQQSLARSLSADTVIIEHRHRDGSTSEQHAKLGKTMSDFRQRTELINTKVSPMLREVEDLDVQIAAALSELRRNGETTAQVDQDLRAELAVLDAEADRASKQTLDEIKAARKDDKAASELVDKKFRELATLL